MHHSAGGNAERENSSTDVAGTSGLLNDKLQQPLSEEAKKKRRQEINRESARRVRKRKTEAHVQLQEEVGLSFTDTASLNSIAVAPSRCNCEGTTHYLHCLRQAMATVFECPVSTRV